MLKSGVLPAATRLLSLRTKIVLAMALVAAVVVGATLFTTHRLRRAQLLEEFQAFVRGVAGTTALALSGDEIDSIRTNADAAKPAFQNARGLLEKSRAVNGLAEQELYILRPIAGAAQLETEFVVMLQRKPFVGSRYVIPAGNRPHLLEAWNDPMPAATEIYHDENGNWISGYAAVFNRAGRPVAILEADAEVDRFLQKQRTELLLGLGIGAGAFVVAMIPGLLLARAVTQGLNKLSHGMQRFKAGEHSVQVSVRTGDELEELGGVFNEMILSLGEKLALLPYVSRFTAEAVRRSRHDPSWLTGSEQQVVMLFADLRGFTSFSETREAVVLVRELNRLLAVQADVVVGAGGDVDKFVGDAVMAVFLDGEDSAQRVFECAQQLLARVHAETVAQNWTLGLGVGIHRGRVIVGSIGSETRRDFTAIGHTVNIASRLCDKARSWEILVSENFYELLPAETQSGFARTEPMQFKNVSQTFGTYRFTSGVVSSM